MFFSVIGAIQIHYYYYCYYKDWKWVGMGCSHYYYYHCYYYYYYYYYYILCDHPKVPSFSERCLRPNLRNSTEIREILQVLFKFY